MKYGQRRVKLFHRNFQPTIFEFYSEEAEQLKKAEGWVENARDLKVEIAQKPIVEIESKPEEEIPLEKTFEIREEMFTPTITEQPIEPKITRKYKHSKTWLKNRKRGKKRC